MSSISITYTPIAIINPITHEVTDEIFVPKVPIKISLMNGKISLPIDALVDSGSDGNLFPATLGEAIGLDFQKAPVKVLYGIGNSIIRVFSSKITLWINSQKFESIADFSYEQKEPLLGRHGFFDLFNQVIFKEQEKYLELKFK